MAAATLRRGLLAAAATVGRVLDRLAARQDRRLLGRRPRLGYRASAIVSRC
jgi:hypothetical protein